MMLQVSAPDANQRIRVAKGLLVFSGLAALVYQTIWIKQLTLVVGIDVYAVTTGVSGFFAGLALGSALFGRLADQDGDGPLPWKHEHREPHQD